MMRPLAWLLAAAAPLALAADGPEAWPIAGRQGLVLTLIVPADQATDRAAYARQIERLCQPQRTCFINFHTNSTGAPLTMPLPDAIAREATAVFRRSAKNGTERFQWSCRMNVAPNDCF